MVATNETPVDAGPPTIPTLQPRPSVPTGFRPACGASGKLNINGTNTYQFVMINPVGRVDPSGHVTGKDVLTWMTATYHEVPGGGEWVDAAGIISRTHRPWIYKTAQNPAIHDMDRCPAKGTKNDPYYHGLMNMAQGQPLTTAEHDALQRWLNTVYPFWDVFWMHVFNRL
jgi:hypothetical protein